MLPLRKKEEMCGCPGPGHVFNYLKLNK